MTAGQTGFCDAPLTWCFVLLGPHVICHLMMTLDYSGCTFAIHRPRTLGSDDVSVADPEKTIG